MKKVLAGIAVLAFVAAAQAELLATWSTGSNVGTVTEAGVDHVSIGNLSLYGGAATTGSSVWGMNSLVPSDANPQSGFKFTVTVDADYEVVDTMLAGNYTGSPTGPRNLDIINTANGSVLNTISRTTQSGTFNQGIGTLNAGATTIAVVARTDGTARSANETFTNNSGTFLLRSSDALTLSGNVQQASSSVPEPATMSLLGLGALAMALRRKLRK